MLTAINFDGESYDNSKPLGINVASNEFIKAFFRHKNQNNFPCVCPNENALNDFKQFAELSKIKESDCIGVNQNDADTLGTFGNIFRPDPNIIKLSWTRYHYGTSLYSLSGLVHNVATDRVRNIINQLVIAPTQNWDALICPSKAIKSVVQTLINNWEGYLKERGGKSFSCDIQLPIIPLGIDTQFFDKISIPNERKRQRALLKIENEEVVILYSGRLNFLAKANPLPLLLSAEQIALETKVPISIIFHGYFNDDFNKQSFEVAINQICSVCRVIFVDHNDNNFSDGVWAASDIFCSLSDNVQESFGLTPIEAMAAGLPVVVSDWDGYRDSVRHGIDGYAIPTLMPPQDAGEDIAYKYFSGQTNYGDYLAATQQSTAVNIGELTNALKILINNPEQRHQMGQTAKEHAKSAFDWAEIIPAYEKLWSELDQRRNSEKPKQLRHRKQHFHPSHPDPFSLFKNFPTSELSRTDYIHLEVKNWDEIIKLIKLKISLVYPEPLLNFEDISQLILKLEKYPSQTVNNILDNMPKTNERELLRTIVWLIKIGVCGHHEEV
tara:strand:+ start:441 stop:2099 length:1659 start_codon:yes stop_codon:yes gene_type:complete